MGKKEKIMKDTEKIIDLLKWIVVLMAVQIFFTIVLS